MVGLGLSCFGILWWSEEAQLPKTGSVDISSTERGLAELFTLPAADATPLAHLLPTITNFSAMVERPLFSPDRRDQPAKPLNQLPVVEEANRPELSTDPIVAFIGTVADSNGFRAIISDQKGVRSVTIGQYIDGWHVMMIDARRLTLEHGNEHIILNILEGES